MSQTTHKKRKRRKQASRLPMILGFILMLALVTFLIVIVTIFRMTDTVQSKEFPLAQKQLYQSADTRTEAELAKMCLPEQQESVRAMPSAGESAALSLPQYAETAAPQVQPEANAEQPETEMIDIVGDYYRGKLLLVKDPSRVIIGVSGPYGAAAYGKKVNEICANYGAIAGVNASGFEDIGGVGHGGTPLGLVISQGELKWGGLGTVYEVCGFDNQGNLHCGYMSGQQALNIGIRDTANFGPILISDGVKSAALPYNGPRTARTAIGQREDGTVLILMLEGRQIESLGVGTSELADIMLEYGAVNAGNMDGGASTVMYYQGELVNHPTSLYGDRNVPTAWIVLPE